MRSLLAVAIGALLLSGCTAQTQGAAKDLAACSKQSGSPAEVAAACDRLVAATVGNKDEQAQALFYRGLVRSRIGMPEEALADLNESLRLAPGNTAVLTGRGTLYMQQGNPELALRDLNAAVASAPGDLDAVGNRAIFYQETGRVAESIADFDRVIEIAPKDYRGWNGRCWARAVGNRELELAMADCEQSIALMPTDWNTTNSLGFVQFRMGRYPEAIASYDRAIEGDPKTASSWLVRGLAKRAAGLNGGDEDVAKGEAMDPKVADRYRGYGIQID